MANSRTLIRDISDIKALEETPFDQRDCERTVYDIVKAGASLNPDKSAFLNLSTGSPAEEAVRISYSQFLYQVNQCANLFHSLGVGQEDTVAVLLPIVPQNYVAMIGAATVGKLCPINWVLKPEQIASILRMVGAKVLVALAPADGYDVWKKAIYLNEVVDCLEKVIPVSLPGYEFSSAPPFDALLGQQNGDGLDFTPTAKPDDVAIFAHTGGTTGMPKVAQLRHSGIAYKVWAYSVLLESSPEHIVFAGSPLFHIGGIVYHTINALAHGATSLIVGPMGFRNKEVVLNYWRLVERFRITDFFGVPTTLSALANVPVGNSDISSLRPYTMTGSAGLPIEISKYFEREIGVRLLSNYGMTENTATIALPPRDGDPKYGSSGLRLPYTELRIVQFGDDGRIVRECEVDEIGEIIVRGPGVMPGYLGEQINRQQFIEDGWLVTGDLGRLDGDEYLWITGRKKDVIIRGGHNIDPRAIEDALMSHEAVALAGAVGRPDSYAGELPVAFVQLKPGRTASAQILHDFAAAKIPERAAVPTEIFIVEEIPLTPVGKIFKPELRKWAAKQKFNSLLSPLRELHADYVVDLSDHPKHGTICKIGIAVQPELKLQAKDIVERAMQEFTTAYEIEWKPR